MEPVSPPGTLSPGQGLGFVYLTCRKKWAAVENEIPAEITDELFGQNETGMDDDATARIMRSRIRIF